MFNNLSFEEIFIVNKVTNEIHGASTLTAQCNLKGEPLSDGKFNVHASTNRAQEIENYENIIRQGLPLDFCGHCFPDLSKR